MMKIRVEELRYLTERSLLLASVAGLDTAPHKAVRLENKQFVSAQAHIDQAQSQSYYASAVCALQVDMTGLTSVVQRRSEVDLHVQLIAHTARIFRCIEAYRLCLCNSRHIVVIDLLAKVMNDFPMTVSICYVTTWYPCTEETTLAYKPI
jgi:hypothetical protein